MHYGIILRLLRIMKKTVLTAPPASARIVLRILEVHRMQVAQNCNTM